MSIELLLTTQVKVVETFTGVFVNPADKTATFDGLSETLDLTGSTSVPVSQHAEGDLALAAGAGTLDLTNLPGITAGEVVNGTGLRLQAMKVRNKGTNTHPVTVAKGGTNGYGLDAAGDAWSVVLSPGQSITFYGDEAAPLVGPTAKTIGVTGTGTDVLEYAIVMG